jgi:hypothetical protein
MRYIDGCDHDMLDGGEGCELEDTRPYLWGDTIDSRLVEHRPGQHGHPVGQRFATLSLWGFDERNRELSSARAATTLIKGDVPCEVASARAGTRHGQRRTED